MTRNNLIRKKSILPFLKDMTNAVKSYPLIFERGNVLFSIVLNEINVDLCNSSNKPLKGCMKQLTIANQIAEAPGRWINEPEKTEQCSIVKMEFIDSHIKYPSTTLVSVERISMEIELLYLEPIDETNHSPNVLNVATKLKLSIPTNKIAVSTQNITDLLTLVRENFIYDDRKSNQYDFRWTIVPSTIGEYANFILDAPNLNITVASNQAEYNLDIHSLLLCCKGIRDAEKATQLHMSIAAPKIAYASKSEYNFEAELVNTTVQYCSVIGKSVWKFMHESMLHIYYTHHDNKQLFLQSANLVVERTSQLNDETTICMNEGTANFNLKAISSLIRQFTNPSSQQAIIASKESKYIVKVDKLCASFDNHLDQPFISVDTAAALFEYSIANNKSALLLKFGNSILYDMTNFPYNNFKKTVLGKINDQFRLGIAFSGSASYLDDMITSEIELSICNASIVFYYQYFICRMLPYFIEQVPNAFYSNATLRNQLLKKIGGYPEKITYEHVYDKRKYMLRIQLQNITFELVEGYRLQCKNVAITNKYSEVMGRWIQNKEAPFPCIELQIQSQDSYLLNGSSIITNNIGISIDVQMPRVEIEDMKNHNTQILDMSSHFDINIGNTKLSISPEDTGSIIKMVMMNFTIDDNSNAYYYLQESPALSDGMYCSIKFNIGQLIAAVNDSIIGAEKVAVNIEMDYAQNVKYFIKANKLEIKSKQEVIIDSKQATIEISSSETKTQFNILIQDMSANPIIKEISEVLHNIKAPQYSDEETALFRKHNKEMFILNAELINVHTKLDTTEQYFPPLFTGNIIVSVVSSNSILKLLVEFDKFMLCLLDRVVLNPCNVHIVYKNTNSINAYKISSKQPICVNANPKEIMHLAASSYHNYAMFQKHFKSIILPDLQYSGSVLRYLRSVKKNIFKSSKSSLIANEYKTNLKSVEVTVIMEVQNKCVPICKLMLSDWKLYAHVSSQFINKTKGNVKFEYYNIGNGVYEPIIDTSDLLLKMQLTSAQDIITLNVDNLKLNICEDFLYFISMVANSINHMRVQNLFSNDLITIAQIRNYTGTPMSYSIFGTNYVTNNEDTTQIQLPYSKSIQIMNRDAFPLLDVVADNKIVLHNINIYSSSNIGKYRISSNCSDFIKTITITSGVEIKNSTSIPITIYHQSNGNKPEMVQPNSKLHTCSAKCTIEADQIKVNLPTKSKIIFLGQYALFVKQREDKICIHPQWKAINTVPYKVHLYVPSMHHTFCLNQNDNAKLCQSFNFFKISIGSYCSAAIFIKDQKYIEVPLTNGESTISLFIKVSNTKRKLIIHANSIITTVIPGIIVHYKSQVLPPAENGIWIIDNEHSKVRIEYEHKQSQQFTTNRKINSDSILPIENSYQFIINSALHPIYSNTIYRQINILSNLEMQNTSSYTFTFTHNATGISNVLSPNCWMCYNYSDKIFKMQYQNNCIDVDFDSPISKQSIHIGHLLLISKFIDKEQCKIAISNCDAPTHVLQNYLHELNIVACVDGNWKNSYVLSPHQKADIIIKSLLKTQTVKIGVLIETKHGKVVDDKSIIEFDLNDTCTDNYSQFRYGECMLLIMVNAFTEKGIRVYKITQCDETVDVDKHSLIIFDAKNIFLSLIWKIIEQRSELLLLHLVNTKVIHRKQDGEIYSVQVENIQVDNNYVGSQLFPHSLFTELSLQDGASVVRNTISFILLKQEEV